MEWRKKGGWEDDVSSKGPLWRFPSLLIFLLGVVWCGVVEERIFRGFFDAISVSRGCEVGVTYGTCASPLLLLAPWLRFWLCGHGSEG